MRAGGVADTQTPVTRPNTALVTNNIQNWDRNDKKKRQGAAAVMLIVMMTSGCVQAWSASQPAPSLPRVLDTPMEDINMAAWTPGTRRMTTCLACLYHVSYHVSRVLEAGS